jgi:hypothetical protein
MTVSARRIIRHKGSQAAVLVGNSRVFNNIEELLAWAKRRKVVFAYLDSAGNEGTIRSGRLMRRVDQHVKNCITSLGAIQINLDFDTKPDTVPELLANVG